jgi:hypothetical protein
MLLPLLIAASVAAAGASPEAQGTIRGTVVNASASKAPVAQATVVLRAESASELRPLEETTTDASGRFVFSGLATDSRRVYLAGANRAGVHYPGPRVQLTPQQPSAEVEIRVFDAVEEPCPLVIRSQFITVRPQPGSLRVTESLTIENPSTTCYVGKPPQQGAEPVTLTLAIPPDFQRATFHKEFFGRRFGVLGSRLATGIPWPPGQQKLELTYVVPNGGRRGVWERSLDLPCSRLRLCVETDKPGEVSSNLPRTSLDPGRQVVFESSAETLPAGYAVRLELGPVPLPAMVYARWVAAGALAGLIVWTWLVVRRHRARTSLVSPQAASLAPRASAGRVSAKAGRRAARRSRKRAA